MHVQAVHIMKGSYQYMVNDILNYDQREDVTFAARALHSPRIALKRSFSSIYCSSKMQVNLKCGMQ